MSISLAGRKGMKFTRILLCKKKILLMNLQQPTVILFGFLLKFYIEIMPKNEILKVSFLPLSHCTHIEQTLFSVVVFLISTDRSIFIPSTRKICEYSWCHDPNGMSKSLSQYYRPFIILKDTKGKNKPSILIRYKNS